MFLSSDTFKHIPWPQLFVEAVLVVLSVLLALALNSWRQNEIQDDIAAQALHNIIDEVKANKVKIEEALLHHRALIDTMKNQAMPPGIPLKPALIEDNAWETAQATQAIIHLDFNIASKVSEIHELQSLYKQIVQGVIQVLYMGPNPGMDRSRLLMLFDLQGVEQLLLQSYKDFLALVEP